MNQKDKRCRIHRVNGFLFSHCNRNYMLGNGYRQSDKEVFGGLHVISVIKVIMGDFAFKINEGGQNYIICKLGHSFEKNKTFVNAFPKRINEVSKTIHLFKVKWHTSAK